MSRSSSWKFPRWGGYDFRDGEPARIRLCDRKGCEAAGEHPAPKSRFSNDKWWFCESHAAEYNRTWNYFESMSEEEIRAHQEEEKARANAYAKSTSWSWTGAHVDREHREALGILGLEEEADEAAIKRQYRKLAKIYHPDRNPEDAEAERMFRKITAAYQFLRQRNSE